MIRQDLRPEVGQIKLSLHSNLVRYVGEKTNSFSWPIHEGETIQSLIEKLKIPGEEIGLIVINGSTQKDRQLVLHPGDEVKIFGLVGGG
ncbi:MAG: MoaD/ThiS family protein [Thermodesulfobacteriota bacterium]